MTTSFDTALAEAPVLPSIDEGAMKRLTDDRLERRVAAGALFYETGVDELEGVVANTDFYTHALGTIVRAARELRATGERRDVTTVGAWLHRRDLLGGVGGEDFLHGLHLDLPRVEALRTLGTLVADLAQQRAMVHAARRIVADGLVSRDDPRAFVERSAASINSVAERKPDTAIVPISTVIRRRAVEIEEIRAGARSPMGMPSGFAEIDAITRGMKLGHMTFVGALTGGGKSILAMQIATYLAGQIYNGQKIGVCYVSGEMPADDLGDRALCSLAGVSEEELFAGSPIRGESRETFEERIDTITTAQQALDAKPICFMHKVADLADVRYAVREARRDFRTNAADPANAPDVKLLVVDYLQMMKLGRGRGGGDDRHDVALGQFAHGLKEIAASENLHVLAPVQVLKTSRFNAAGRPQVEDIKHSTGLGDAASTVMFVHRPVRLMDSAPKETRRRWSRYTEIVVRKGRGHGTAIVRVCWEGDRYRLVAPKPGELDGLDPDEIEGLIRPKGHRGVAA
jgi:replicative DNA helicase